MAIDIYAKKAKVALLQQRADLLHQQFDFLTNAENARSLLTAKTQVSTVKAAMLGSSSVSSDQRQALWLAIGSYLRADAIKPEINAVDLRLTAASRASSLAYTESNVNAWRSLIEAHITQLVAWSKAGVKSSDITSTLQTIAAWWIAHGVNK